MLVIDGITLWGFDFIDLGRIRLPSNTVPVTIKSLVFSEDPRSHGKSTPHVAAPAPTPAPTLPAPSASPANDHAQPA